MIRLLAGAVVLAVAGALALGCNDAPPPAATRTAIAIDETSAAYRAATYVQPTIARPPTPKPIGLERNLLRQAPACAGCLVVADQRATQGIDSSTGDVTVISEIPAEATTPYSWQPSPDGSMWVFPCNDDGTPAGDPGVARCLWGYGLAGMPIADPIEPDAYLYAVATSWSPDSRYLVMYGYSKVDAGSGGFVPETRAYLYDVRTGSTRNIGSRAPFQEFGEPSWSPDGKRLAIARTRNGVYSNVVVVDAASAFPRLITADEKALVLSIGSIVWSADSKQIAFVRDTVEPLTPVAGVARSFKHTIVIASADGSTIREVPGTFGLPLGWSPDGEWLLVERGEPASAATGYRDQPLIFAMQTETGSQHLLSEGFLEMTDAVFSPDGSRVAFIGTGDPNDNTTRGLFVVDVSGGAAVKLPLSILPHAPPAPVWTKDGRSIVFTARGGCGKGGCSPGALYIVDAGGASPAVELLPYASQILGWLPE